jgi:hypothetical protein
MLSVETFNEVRDLRVFKTSEMGTAQATAAKSVKSAKPEKKRKKTKQ